MSFRRGTRRNDSRYSYPVSGRVNENHVPKNLNIKRYKPPTCDELEKIVRDLYTLRDAVGENNPDYIHLTDKIKRGMLELELRCGKRAWALEAEREIKVIPDGVQNELEKRDMLKAGYTQNDIDRGRWGLGDSYDKINGMFSERESKRELARRSMINGGFTQKEIDEVFILIERLAGKSLLDMSDEEIGFWLKDIKSDYRKINEYEDDNK